MASGADEINDDTMKDMVYTDTNEPIRAANSVGNYPRHRVYSGVVGAVLPAPPARSAVAAHCPLNRHAGGVRVLDFYADEHCR